LLGAYTPVGKILATAAPTKFRSCLLVSAVVTEEPSAHPVKRERNRTMDAAPNVAAHPALEEVRVTATVEEQDHLLLPAETLAHGLDQTRRKDRAAAPAVFLKLPP
jgi:hypothetical protein